MKKLLILATVFGLATTNCGWIDGGDMSGWGAMSQGGFKSGTFKKSQIKKTMAMKLMKKIYSLEQRIARLEAKEKLRKQMMINVFKAMRKAAMQTILEAKAKGYYGNSSDSWSGKDCDWSGKSAWAGKSGCDWNSKTMECDWSDSDDSDDSWS